MNPGRRLVRVLVHAVERQIRLGVDRVAQRHQPPQDLGGVAGDGFAVDAEGNYWCALFEGARLVKLAPDGRLLEELPLPVRCPTMPCFGGSDLCTLFVTTARQGRPAAELEAMPQSGEVLWTRVGVPGLPVNFFSD